MRKVNQFNMPRDFGSSFGTKQSIENYCSNNLLLSWQNFKFDFRKQTYIMGILNLTPDSFSGDGVYREGKITLEKIVDIAEKMQEDGADIIDVGGESTRPYAKKISQQEEEHRIVPVIKKLAKVLKIPISIDTYKSSVAKKALDNGASLVNDITALNGDKDMAKLIAKYKVGVVLMHMKGTPRTMQKNPTYKCLIGEIITALSKSIEKALKAGIDKNKIIIDPGIGFGKTTLHNLVILNNLNELKVLGHSILIGVSRKSFIGNILDLSVNECLLGTSACVSVAIIKGANILRVHDVAQIKQVVRMVDAIKNP